jgi:Ni,Fe-hydrogenase III large subunit
VLVAERVNGTQAFAHGLAFAQAVEALGAAVVPPRARTIRTALAEWERLRSHVATLAGIVESTGLSIPANLLAAVEEHLLQLSARYLGHRYLFGLVALGGLSRDPGDDALQALARAGVEAGGSVQAVCHRLTFDNSFLDRLEAVGMLPPARAATLGLVGPVGRASGAPADVRCWHPYAAYGKHLVTPVIESEGDGYARFRVFRREVAASVDLIQRCAAALPAGPVQTPVPVVPGVGLAAVEAPSGALAYWVRAGSAGQIDRCHIMTPAFLNWHGLADAVRDFAFQDFPIIVSTLGLSVADADR